MSDEDLFEEIDRAALEHGWTRQFTKDMRYARRFDRGPFTIRVFANKGGYGLARCWISYLGYTRTAMISKHRGKRKAVLAWLADPGPTE